MISRLRIGLRLTNRKPAMRFLRSFLLISTVLVAVASVARACPFCSAVTMTFGEEMKQSEVAVIARLVERGELPKDPTATVVPGASDSKFEVAEVLKGQKALGDTRTFKAVYFGKEPIGSTFLVMAAEPPVLKWSAPIKLSDLAVEYVKQSSKLPETGADRLAFFQNYLNDKDSLLAQDAYDEFAKADYKVVQDLKPRMDRQQLLAWIQDPEMPASRRRLFFTMLGVCGEPEDVAVLEKMLKSKDVKSKVGLDAMIASYLTLKGPSGMPLIEELFISNSDTPFTETYKAIMALRFLGEDESAVPRKRVVKALRLMLERPKYADLVIPDLARWEDWEAMPRLVQLFKNATKENSWVRVPVLRYLQACPLPEAETHIVALSKLDPSAAKRAASFFPLQGAKPPEKKPEDKDAAAADAPTIDNTPKTASETAAPTTSAQKPVHRVDKPVVAEATQVRSGDEVAVVMPWQVSDPAEQSSFTMLQLIMAFSGVAALLTLAMWKLLFGSVQYEKIAKHGVRRR